MMEGMRDSLKANQYKLINAAKGVAGELNDAINSDLSLATDSIAVNADSTITQRGTIVPTEDKDTSLVKELLEEMRKMNQKNTEYNINIDNVDVTDANDVRKLAEDLEFFRNKDFRY